ncbi:hypothetical protein N6B72_05065 [Chryseobacterium soli]|nr:hypothetical protein [Chryseobacterium soli]MDV7696285.1 hypothetical protein [Chryseobacterium soli]
MRRFHFLRRDWQTKQSGNVKNQAIEVKYQRGPITVDSVEDGT